MIPAVAIYFSVLTQKFCDVDRDYNRIVQAYIHNSPGEWEDTRKLLYAKMALINKCGYSKYQKGH